jgi:hypothetical protein
MNVYIRSLSENGMHAIVIYARKILLFTFATKPPIKLEFFESTNFATNCYAEKF